MPLVNTLRAYVLKYQLASIIRYVVSGGTAAVVNIGTLYAFTEYGHVYYIVSAIIAFLTAFLVSFFLQKFWTFQNTARDNMHRQMFWYLLVTLANLACNTALLFLLVELFRIWYILAEIIVALVLAVATFFVYRHLIFRDV